MSWPDRARRAGPRNTRPPGQTTHTRAGRADAGDVHPSPTPADEARHTFASFHQWLVGQGWQVLDGTDGALVATRDRRALHAQVHADLPGAYARLHATAPPAGLDVHRAVVVPTDAARSPYAPGIEVFTVDPDGTCRLVHP